LSEEATTPEQNRGKVALLILSCALGAGVLGMLVNALQTPDKFASRVGISFLVAGAAALCGSLLGFLFGIPRAPDDNSNERGGYRANTNLEQISDWLTKILVGVGLTQLDAIPRKLEEVAEVISPGLGLDSNGHVLALSAVVFFLIAGFLFGYLWTRLFLPGAFRQADLAAVTKQIQKAIDQNAEQDALALTLAHRQLDPSPGAPEVPVTELVAAIKAAKQPTRIQIFYRAQVVRTETWRNEKKRMERTIPIFRALVEADPNQFHRNYGQLGYALKDKEQPDWAEAERMLSEAIRIRGPWREKGWLYYEFNRAICRINLDSMFIQNKPSSPTTIERVAEDLAAVFQTDLRNPAEADPTISSWLRLNQLTADGLANRRSIRGEEHG
jgi:hypothetical protein